MQHKLSGQIMTISDNNAALTKIIDRAKSYARKSKAPATLRARQTDWNHFVAWCDENGLASLPATPKTVILYLTALADERAVSTLERRLTTISVMHQAAGHQSPTGDIQVRTVWAGIRRDKGTAYKQVAPLVTDELRAVVNALPDTLGGVRDRAMLLVGFVAALRRSELVSIDVENLTLTAEGYTFTVRRSKDDQEATGKQRAIPYGSNPETCPVRALQAWLKASGIKSGPVFRGVNRHGQVATTRLTGHSVALVIKRSVEAVGLDPARYSGHSLRAGFITESARSGAHERDIARVSGHRSTHILRRYIRDAQLFQNPAFRAVGL